MQLSRSVQCVYWSQAKYAMPTINSRRKYEKLAVLAQNTSPRTWSFYVVRDLKQRDDDAEDGA